MDDPRYERLSRQAEDYYNRAEARKTPSQEFQKIDEPQELYYEEESSDEEYNDEERIREELRELKYEKTFDCKYCGKCPTIHSPIRCEDVMNDYWQEFAALSQEEKQEIYFTEHNFIGDWKHTRCHDAGVICAGLNANYNDAKYQWQTLHIAVALGDYQLVKHLLEIGKVDPNQYRNTDWAWEAGEFHPLCLARSQRMKDLLLKRGAVLDKPCPKEKAKRKIESLIKGNGDFEEKEGGLS